MHSGYKEKYDSLASVLDYLQQLQESETNANELITRLNAECCKILKCRVSSFFLLNQSTFEFELAGSYTTVKTLEAQRIFDELLETGALPEILANGNNVTRQISAYETAHLVALKNGGMVFALLLLIGDSGFELNDESTSLILSLTGIFALKYFSLNGNKETTRDTKDNSELLNQINNLRQGAEDLHKIIDSIHEGVFLVDKSSKQIHDANLTAVNLVKVTKENLIGRNKDDFFLFFDNSVFQDEIITKEEALLISSEGDSIPIIHTFSDIMLGDYEYQIISFLDISERKMMEDRIQQSRFELEFQVEERTRELVIINDELQEQILEREKAQKENLKLILAIQQSESLIMITDLEGKIEYANPALCKKSGYSIQELLGSNPRIFKSGDLIVGDYEFLWSTLRSGDSCSMEFRNRKKNGDLYWVNSRVSPVKDDAGKIIKYLAVQEDITDKKTYEEELLFAKAKVEKAEKAKSSLLANMSHEFRTPLISILGFSELLEYDLTEKDQLEMVHAIKSGGKRLLNSLESILLLSHLESSHLNFKMKKINIIPLIHNSIELFASEARGKSLELKFETSLEEILVTTEDKYFTQTLNHLIDNAIKYTLSGEIKVTLDYTIEGSRDYILVSVHDTGIGIAKEDQEIIFEAFRQASEGYNRNYEGFGLGLTVAQKTIHLMDGKITVKSTPKVGSIFTIWLPFSSIK